MKLTTLFPVLTALLIAAFYLFLPELGVCVLPGGQRAEAEAKKKGGKKKREEKKAAAQPRPVEKNGERIALVLVTLLYALVAFFTKERA